jgi:peroxiredoxin
MSVGRTFISGVCVGLMLSLGFQMWRDNERKHLQNLAQPQLMMPRQFTSLPPPWLPEFGPGLSEELKLKSLGGQPVSLKEFHGKPIFLNFWETSCGPCVLELSSIDNLYASLRDQGIVFMAVSAEDPNILRDFIRKNDLRVPVFIWLNENEITRNLPGVPTTVIIDRQGKAIFHHIGAANWNDEAVHKFLLSQR